MDSQEFRRRGKEMVEYICQYLETLEDRKVTPSVEPGYLRHLLPDEAPFHGENWDNIMDDVESKIMPGVTHWQHPRFHAYFPSGNSFPSILGDMLGDGIGCIGFSWAASPACTELETIVLDWLGRALGLPDDFLALKAGSKGGGVIQTSASECVLVTMLAARAQAIKHLKQQHPFVEEGHLLSKLMAYCSKEAHSCVEKAAMICFVKLRILEPDSKCSLRGDTITKAMEEDELQGLVPFFVSTTLGTTGSCSFDALPEIGVALQRFPGVWLHVDAAYAGNAFICPELKYLLKGIEYADSFNTNPNKWLLTNFDCSTLWVRDRIRLTSALVVDPLYLKHGYSDAAIDYRHWGVPLSRRFRSLKLWFVLRSYGISGLQSYIRHHIELAKRFEQLVNKDKRFEICNEVKLGLVCFRLKGSDKLNEKFLSGINASAKIHMVPASVNDQYVIRFCAVAQNASEDDIALKSIRLNDVDIFAWCDNTTVIDWLAKHPITWKTFVANRVSEIQTTLPSVKWRYVSSEDNPADCATRGVESSELKHHNLWWTGPSWLTLEESNWPTLLPPTNSLADLEIRKSSIISQTTVIVNDDLEQLLTKFSSLNKLKRVTAYVLRFVESLKGKRTRKSRIPNVLELDNALQFWLKFSQKKAFPDTLDRLNKGKLIKRRDSLLALNPILGHDGLLRVGGRLVESSLKYDQKHQIILPKSDPITSLIIAEIHKLTIHGGAQVMLNYLRQKYWLIAGRRIINQHIRKCVKCCRVKGRLSNQIMGNLPKSRITIGRAFLRSGVDYTGSIEVRVPTSNSRKFSIVKGYIAVFVCLTTKSIHLEVVSDQSTLAFMNALKRFVSRRGLCRELVSDNGSNFVGAKGELNELWNMLQDQAQCDVIKKSLANDGIDWHMHPPGAPHFSGLFEAGVKSTKFHLRRILGSTPFTFEEWTTILCQIEAVLNSRPLIPLSDDVNDLQVLTPGHFLIGEPLTAIPEPNLEHLKLNTLNRYQLMQRKVQEFWRNWSSDYLSKLQQRTKWKSPVDDLKIGQIVTIKEDDLPTTKWLTGRVINIFPGKDNHVRVAKMKIGNKNLTKKEADKLKLLGFNVSSAKVKTIDGILERPIHKLCVLPINSC